MSIDEYIPVVGKGPVEEIKILAEKLPGKVIKIINSTQMGGGVAEILNRMVPLLNELGVLAKWEIISGSADFFSVTKKIHNALHGAHVTITDEELDLFLQNNRINADEMDLNGDIVFIHDPQPLALVEKKEELGNKWIWRCHIDTHAPDWKLWGFLRKYMEMYDAAVFSSPSFAQTLLINKFLIAPSIDPLSLKNQELSKETIESVLKKFDIKKNKPIVTQISRFDHLKDPIGVIEAYKLVKKSVDCQLILAGGTAADDPESAEVLSEVYERAAGDPDIHVLLLETPADIEVNALQRASTIILQKSISEGFGLTVSEAMWKGKPVIASAVGGITLQITHDYNGLLTRTIEGTAYAIKELLCNPGYAKRLGRNARESAKQNLLVTRHIRDYLLLFLSLYYPGDIVYI
ncbi:glycosyltransferase [Candidatus Oleimmundimicrobium sp.]|uniref:glycosyltransferase n=1 Tax=Candidatus Oleimmundimicrobium sp. TaxID=3060597 RepID=UPI0027256D2C|nr:glycosyltransferase [Candidatus Oleimmundimicrobium sp.]MDO8886542.1 glycosyltransferase [Candidatus Oleimmundimicrobium sp.]